MDPADSPRAGLEAAIEEDPYDPRGYAVLGDYLQEIGDPRGKLIALQLASELDLAARFPEAFTPPKSATFGWAFGYARSAVLEPSNAHATRTTLAHPSCRFLAELRIRGGTTALDSVIAAIHAVPRPTLRVLALGDNSNASPGFDEGIHRAIGDLSKLWSAVPRLAHLELAGAAHDLGKLELPYLESFSLESLDLTTADAEAIAKAKWPALRSLAVTTWNVALLAAFRRRPPKPAIAKWYGTLLARKDLPALTSLALRGTPKTDSLVGSLVMSPVLRQLTRLDLSNGVLSDAGLQTILEHAKLFSGIELVLDGNHLTPTGVERACTALPLVSVDDQYRTPGPGEPEDDEEQETPEDDSEYTANFNRGRGHSADD